MKPHADHSGPSVPLTSEADYVERLLVLYLSLPHTPGRFRARDRLFAASLWHQRVPFAVVNRALLLASLRRLCREPSAPALEPIRTLRYFEGAITETLAEPSDAGYFNYLQAKIRKLHSCPDPAPTKALSTLESRYVQLHLPF